MLINPSLGKLTEAQRCQYFTQDPIVAMEKLEFWAQSTLTLKPGLLRIGSPNVKSSSAEDNGDVYLLFYFIFILV